MAEEKALKNTGLDDQKKLFFVKNSQYNTKSLEMYLSRRDFTIGVSSELSEAVEKIKNLKPDYLFVAWDHTSINVPELLLQVQENDPENKILVIPFITSTSTSDTSRLLQVDAPIKLLPPISGPSVQRLISRYEKEAGHEKTQKTNMAHSHKSASDTINVTSNSQSPGQPQQIYVSKGQKLAELVAAANGSTVMLVDDIIEERSEKPFFDSVTDLTSEKPYAQFSRAHYSKISDGQKHAASQIFENKIKPELIEVIETLKENASTEKTNSSYGVLVQSVDCSGVVILQSEWEIQKDEAEPALTTWAKELTAFYHKGQSSEGVNYELFQSPVLTVIVPQDKDIYTAIREKSSLHKEIIIDDKKTILAFFDLPDNPFNILPAEDEKHFLVDPLCFRASTKIDFDVYLQLKENKKIIKYLKANALISEKEMHALTEKRDAPFLIENRNELAWYKYGLESFLVKL